MLCPSVVLALSTPAPGVDISNLIQYRGAQKEKTRKQNMALMGKGPDKVQERRMGENMTKVHPVSSMKL